MDDSGSPGTSRPTSRAGSVASFATEVPDSPTGPRSISSEIEHIKSLIARSQGVSRQTDGIITAQVFRRRSGSSGPVSQQRIFHELDQLKRRVRHEQQPIRRPSQIDPDTESEAEDVPDEREEELENIRGELVQERQYREEWLEAAETKVDSLTGEKEELHRLLKTSERELEDAKSSRQELHAQNTELMQQLDDAQKSLQDVQHNLQSLQLDKQQSDSTAHEVQEELATLKTSQADVEVLLNEKEKKITGLEHYNRVAGGHLQRLIAEHDTLKDDYLRRQKDLQERHDTMERGAASAEAKLKELEKEVQDHQIHKRELIGQVEEHQNSLHTARRDLDLHGKEMNQLLSEHEKVKDQVQVLTKERDEQKSEHETALAEVEQRANDSAAQAERQASVAEAKLKSEIEDLTSRLEAEQQHKESLRRELETQQALHLEHVRSTESSISQMKEQLAESDQRNVEAEESFKTRESALGNRIMEKDNEIAGIQGQLTEFQQNLHDQSAELREKNAELFQATESARQKLDESNQVHESAVRELRQTQASELDELKDKHASEIESTSELVVKHQDEVKQLQDQMQALTEKHESALAKATEDWQAVSAQLERERESSQKHQSTISSLQTDLSKATDALENAKKDGADDIGRLQTEHDARVSSLEADWSAKAEEASRSHQAEIERVKNEASQQVAQKQDDLQKQLSDRDATSNGQISDIRETHAKELAKTKEDLHAELSNAQKAVEDANTKLQSAEMQHKEAVSELEDMHNDELEMLKKEHEKSEAALATEHETQKAEMEQKHQTSITGYSNAQSDLENQLNDLRARHEDALQTMKDEQASASAEHSRAVGDLEEKNRQMQQDHDAEASAIRRDHQKQLDEARSSLDASAEEMQQKHEATLLEHQTNAADELQSIRRNHAAELETAESEKRKALDDAHRQHEEMSKSFEQRMAELEKSSSDKVTELQASHAKDLEVAQSKQKAEIDSLRQSHEQTNREMQLNWAGQLNALQETHRKNQQETEQSLQSQLNKLKDDHAADITSKEAEWQSTMSALQQEHDRALTDAIETRDDAAKGKHLALERKHAETLVKWQEDLRAEARSKASASETRHRETLDKAVNDVHESSMQEITALKKRHDNDLIQTRRKADKEADMRIVALEQEHESALAEALANADDELDERLKAQAKAHSKELDRLHENLNTELTHLHVQLEEASQLRSLQMDEAEAQSREALAELGTKLRTAEQASKALQARLDAELTGHAEAERSLAEIRKQRFEDDRKSSESKDALQQQVTSLQAEKERLAKQLEAFSNSPKPEPSDGHRGLPTTEGSVAELSALKTRLGEVEKERDEANASVDRAVGEHAEIARQMDFLGKEMEMMMAERNTRMAISNNKTDAGIQTEPSEITPDNMSLSVLRELKADAATSEAVKREHSRPTTPSSQKRVNGVSGHSKSRSFEEYLQQAQAELSELGSVISANEALFAQKITEHVGDLQRAKDALAAEYKEKFEALSSEKDRMERDVSAKSAAEFAKERKELVAEYGVGHDEPAKHAALVKGLPSPRKRALLNAEERLVSEYNRRIVKRKSQIALKHAEDFQSLTKDYDRRIADLLSDREKIESNLSIEPTKFEQDWGALDVKSVEIERERSTNTKKNVESPKPAIDSPKLRDSTARQETPVQDGSISKSQLPKRNLTSSPRTQTSIPRAVPFPGNREVSEARFGAQKARAQTQVNTTTSVASEQPLHVRQQSLMSPKSPTDGQLPKRAATVSRGPTDNLASRKEAAQPAPRSNNEPPKVEPEKISPEMQKPKRSLRHSSRFIYGIPGLRES